MNGPILAETAYGNKKKARFFCKTQLSWGDTEKVWWHAVLAESHQSQKFKIWGWDLSWTFYMLVAPKPGTGGQINIFKYWLYYSVAPTACAGFDNAAFKLNTGCRYVIQLVMVIFVENVTNSYLWGQMNLRFVSLFFKEMFKSNIYRKS